MTILVATTLVPRVVPEARRQTPFRRLARVPLSCFVIVAAELSTTVEWPVGLSEVVTLKEDPLTEATGPSTVPESGVAAPAPAVIPSATTRAPTIPAVLLRCVSCATSISFVGAA